jgi:hypothetical protein
VNLSHPFPYLDTVRGMLKLRKQASETMGNVSAAAGKVATSSELASVALLAVAGVAVLALAVAVVALVRVSSR